MTSVKSIIFDCDGVLVDSEILWHRTEVEVKNELGFPITLEEQIERFTGLAHNHASVQEVRRLLPPNFAQVVAARVHAAYVNELRAIDGVDDTLKKITLPKCVASGSEPEKLSFKLQHTRLDQYFDHVFHGRLVENCKPAPDLFIYVLQQMGWNAKNCLLIEDSVAGVQAGRAAGLTVCGFTGGSHILPGHEERLRQAGAHATISQFKDLMRFL